MRRQFFRRPSRELLISPSDLLRRIHLVHNVTHEQVDHGIAATVYFSRHKVGYSYLVVSVGEQNNTQ
jgi:hypothetical protein